MTVFIVMGGIAKSRRTPPSSSRKPCPREDSPPRPTPSCQQDLVACSPWPASSRPESDGSRVLFVQQAHQLVVLLDGLQRLHKHRLSRGRRPMNHQHAPADSAFTGITNRSPRTVINSSCVDPHWPVRAATFSGSLQSHGVAAPLPAGCAAVVARLIGEDPSARSFPQRVQQRCKVVLYQRRRKSGNPRPDAARRRRDQQRAPRTTRSTTVSSALISSASSALLQAAPDRAGRGIEEPVELEAPPPVRDRESRCPLLLRLDPRRSALAPAPAPTRVPAAN